MASQNQVPQCYPSAPPADMFPQTSYPTLPQQPPPYDAPGQGFLGFYTPPPPFPSGQFPGYQGHPSPAQNTFPVPPAGGHNLYPDVWQLPQPQTVPVATDGVGNTPFLTPSRPAPEVPHQGFVIPQVAEPNPSPGPAKQNHSLAHLKDGEAPPGCVVQWRGGEGLQLFFLQKDGHIVSPQKPLIMSVYRRTCGGESAAGMVEVHGCWRMRLFDKGSPVLHTASNCYVFKDETTCPNRVVVIQLPANIAKSVSADLHALLSELSHLQEGEDGVVDKLTTGVNTVYTDLTSKLNTTVKNNAPGAHKSTKWLRKGTGSLVRMGGGLVSKGMHLVADYVPGSEKPQEESSPAHTELLGALKKYRKGLEEGSITYV